MKKKRNSINVYTIVYTIEYVSYKQIINIQNLNDKGNF